VRFDEACAFLKGERPEVISEVVEEMKEAAAKEDFRKAARLRDTVAALKEMTKAHFVRKSPEMRREDAGRGLAELAAALGLPKPPRVIECVDISNLFGTHNVASLVVAVDGLPDRRWYRHFKIESFEGADDPRAMAEVVRRRYGPDSTLTAKSPRADLYICDGGVTQLRAARAVFAELGITDIPTVGLAKRMEELVTDDGGEPLLLPRDSEGLMVVTRLRDEAHRFAITYHRSLRERTIRESALDDVPGIGPAKKMALLKRFHSVYGIARATEDEIAAVAGIGATLAAAVRKAAASAAGEKS
jgi:excinuclease ABC subunit C